MKFQFTTTSGSIVEVTDKKRFEVLRFGRGRHEPLHFMRGDIQESRVELGKPAMLTLAKSGRMVQTSLVTDIKELR